MIKNLENFQTEFEYWQNEVKNALNDWLQETEKYHKYAEQFYTISLNGVVQTKQTKFFDKDEFIIMNGMRDRIEEKSQKLEDLKKRWLSFKK